MGEENRMKNDRYRKMTAALVLLVLFIVLLGLSLSPIPEMTLGAHAASVPLSIALAFFQ